MRYRGKDEEVVFPASYEGKPVKTIGDGFASNNKRIKHATIPEGYTSIGDAAPGSLTSNFQKVLLPLERMYFVAVQGLRI